MARIFLQKRVVLPVLALAFLMSLCPGNNISAAVVPALNSSAPAGISAILDNPGVMARLSGLGYSRDQVRDVLTGLSPAERSSLLRKADILNRGGDVFGVLLVIVLIVALVVVLLKATGHQLKMETHLG